jgi:hypothetical protein
MCRDIECAAASHAYPSCRDTFVGAYVTPLPKSSSYIILLQRNKSRQSVALAGFSGV